MARPLPGDLDGSDDVLSALLKSADHGRSAQNRQSVYSAPSGSNRVPSTARIINAPLPSYEMGGLDGLDGLDDDFGRV
jgi:hypothetical protein